MKMKKRIGFVVFTIILVFLLSGCMGDYTMTIEQDSIVQEEPKPITYEALLYDNQGNNFLRFEGNRFTISPNKIKQYGWNTDGTWTSYYETSSVMTIEIDGKYIQSCGSTVIFKDTRLSMLEIPRELSTTGAQTTDGYSVTEDRQYLESYIGLQNWWYDIQEKGQYGSKVILIQSQDGYNIGAFIGSDVTWEVAGNLPKTTQIIIDGLPVYIHRCNFTIIDKALIEGNEV